MHCRLIHSLQVKVKKKKKFVFHACIPNNCTNKIAFFINKIIKKVPKT